MRQLPTGTVTMLFTDVEGSTRLLQELGRERYVEALETHRRLLREACTQHGGVEVEMQGDSFHFAFETAQGGRPHGGRGATRGKTLAQRATLSSAIRRTLFSPPPDRARSVSSHRPAQLIRVYPLNTTR
jgi:class 3 adenylate cyclase